MNYSEALDVIYNDKNPLHDQYKANVRHVVDQVERAFAQHFGQKEVNPNSIIGEPMSRFDGTPKEKK